QSQDPPPRGHAGVGLRRDQEQARPGAHPDAADAEDEFEQGGEEEGFGPEAGRSCRGGEQDMSENTQQQQHAERGQPKSRIGTVLSNKMTKTVVVQVERRMKHGKYGKYLTEKKKYKCHDEQQSAKP